MVRYGAHPAALAANRSKKQAIFKNFALFTEFISKINNTQVDHAKNFDVVMAKFNLRKNSKISRNFWKYCRNQLDNNL